jgi:hypothetical protein
VAEQNTTKGASPTGVLRSLAAEGGVQLQSCYITLQKTYANSLPDIELSKALIFDTAFLIQ